MDLANSIGGRPERWVVGNDTPIPEREKRRYQWIRSKVKGNKILEIGCSTGYTTRLLRDIPNLNYTGIDKDPDVVKFANENYGSDSIKFIVKNVFDNDFEYYDTIIASEVLEHIEDGLSLIPKLAKLCDRLIITTPYKEPKGYWGPHHVITDIDETPYAKFNIEYQTGDNKITDKAPINVPDAVIMGWRDTKPKVAAYMSTKGRFNTTVPLAMVSIIQQTYKVDSITIFDDNVEDRIDLTKHPVISHCIRYAEMAGIKWYVVYGQGIGQVANHEMALRNLDADYIWRVDDDNFYTPTALAEMMKLFKDDSVAAVGPICLFTRQNPMPCPILAKGTLLGIEATTAQWFLPTSDVPKEAEHLYSTFVYDAEKARATDGYPKNLSIVGHTEETQFTHNLVRAGHKLLISPTALAYHFQQESGGIRQNTRAEMWEHDHNKFYEYLRDCGYLGSRFRSTVIIVLEGGIGDIWMFKSIVPELVDKYEGYDIVLVTECEDIFDDLDTVYTIPMSEFLKVNARHENDNIYKYALDQQWTGDKGNFVELMRKRYITDGYYSQMFTCR